MGAKRETLDGGLAPTAFACLSIAVFAAIAAAIALHNYIHDPLQYTHRTEDPRFSNNERYQVPGLARNYPYDSVLLGTSHTQNFRPADFEQTMGLHLLRLSIRGASVAELSEALRLVLDTGKAKRVFLGLENFSFGWRAEKFGRKSGEFPLHLYRGGPLGVARYLFSIDTLLWPRTDRSWTSHLTERNAWIWKPKYGRSQVEDAVLQLIGARKNKQLEGAVVDGAAESRKPASKEEIDSYDAEADRREIRRLLHTYIVDVIEDHPQVKVDVFTIPKSFAYHMIIEYRGKARRIDAFRREVLALSSHPQITVHDTAAHMATIQNFVNYKDPGHYHPRVNRWVTEQIASGALVVRPDEVDRAVRNFRKKLDQRRDRICTPGHPHNFVCPETMRLAVEGARTDRAAKRRGKGGKRKREK